VATPYVSSSSKVVFPGGELHFKGQLRGETAEQYQIKIDGKQCILRDSYTSVNADGVEMNNDRKRRARREAGGSQSRSAVSEIIGFEPNSDSTDVFDDEQGAADVETRVILEDVEDVVHEWCQLPEDLEAGRYNYSVHIFPSKQAGDEGGSGKIGFGDAMFTERMELANDIIYEDLVTAHGDKAHVVTVLPSVVGLSAGTSGSLGGHEVVVTGTGFAGEHVDVGCGDNEVLLAGVPCEVLACSNTMVRCVVGPANDTLSAPTAGTIGLTKKTWTQSLGDVDGWESYSEFANSMTQTAVGGTINRGSFGTESPDSKSDELSGYFVAPVTSRYRFWVAGKANSAVYLNENGADFNGMTKIVEGAESPTVIQQQSEPVSLVGGERYAFRTRHSGSGYFMASVEMMDPPDVATPHVMQYHRVNEIQRIELSGSYGRQVQTITISDVGVGGSFQIAGAIDPYNRRPKMSEEIAVVSDNKNAMQSGLRNALRSTYNGGCRSFSVECEDQLAPSSQLIFKVTFRCDPKQENGNLQLFEQIMVNGEKLVPAGGLRHRSARAVATVRVATTKRPTTALEGTFQLTLGDFAMEPMNLDIEAEEFAATMVRFLPDVQGVNVRKFADTRTQDDVEIQFVGFDVIFAAPQGKNEPQFAVDIEKFARLYGSNVLATVTTLQQGNPSSRLYQPIPDGMLEVAREASSVSIRANGINAKCADESGTKCTFVYDATLTPEITKITSGGDGEVKAGEVLTINGENLKMGTGGATVMFGGAECKIATHTSSQITCKVRHATHGVYHPEVVVEGAGRANVAAGVPMFKYAGAIDSVAPLVTGVRGGAILTIIGTGFSEDGPKNNVTVGGLPCAVVSVTFDRLECIAPAVNIPNIDQMVHGGELVETTAVPTTTTIAAETTTTTTTIIAVAEVQDGVFDHRSGFKAEWSASDKGADHIKFNLSGTFSIDGVYYAAVGIKGSEDAASSMKGADVAMCVVDTAANKGEVVDMVNEGYSGPKKDAASQDLELLASGVDGTSFYCTFERPLTAKERADDRTISSGETNFIWAVGTYAKLPSENGRISKHSAKGSSKATFVADGRRDRREEEVVWPHEADIVIGLFEGKAYDAPLEYDWDETPSVATVSPKMFSSALTTTVTVELEDFRAMSSDETEGCTTTMSFVSPSGLVRNCEQLQMNGTTITCMVLKSEPLPSVEQPMMFPRLQLCTSTGALVVAHPAPAYSTIDVALRIDSTFPTIGSIAGGTVLTISGSGFVAKDLQMVRSAVTYNYQETMMKVNIALADRTVPCQVTSSDFSVIECVTIFPETETVTLTNGPAVEYTGDGRNGVVSVAINDFNVMGCEEDPNQFDPTSNATSIAYADTETFRCEFDYGGSDAKILDSITPTSGVGEVQVIISGSGFTSQPEVSVGKTECTVQAFDETSITCVVTAMVVGSYPVSVRFENFGFAAHPRAADAALRFESKTSFTGIVPGASSLQGGAVVALEGAGFEPSSIGAGNTVLIGGEPAHVIESNLTHIVVVTPIGVVGTAEISITVEPTRDEEVSKYYGQVLPVVIAVGGNGPISWGMDTSKVDASRTVRKGDTVSWVLDLDVEPHSVVSGPPGKPDGIFSSNTNSTTFQTLAAGESWDYKFDEVGTFPYYCDPHAFMAGTITVVEELVEEQTVFEVHASDRISFEYKEEITPVVASITPAKGAEGDYLKIFGTGFDASEGSTTEVLIGAEECVVSADDAATSISDTEIVCRVGATPGGNHHVYVTAGGYGTARFEGGEQAMFQSKITVTGLSSSQGSFGGGTEITISGSGFGGGADGVRRRDRRDGAWGGWIIYDRTDNSEDDVEYGTVIKMCNTECKVVASTYGEVTCVTQPLQSVESLTLYNDMEPSLFEVESYISSEENKSNTAAAAFNGDFTAFFKGSDEESYVGVDLGEDSRAVLTRLRFFPKHQAASKMVGGVFETSGDGARWANLATIAEAHQGWNWITVDPTTQAHARYIRYKGPDGSGSIVTKLEFYGFRVAAGSLCPLTVVTTTPLSHPSMGPITTNHDAFETFESTETFEFVEEKTGIITSVYPRFGSSLGGETVTINGTNLATSEEFAEVYINGKECMVTDVLADGTSITCVTTSRGHLDEMLPSSLEVSNTASGMGDAMSTFSLQYRYLDRWSALNTWLNDQPPVAGDFVTIPEDQTILLDESPPRLSVLLVLGALVFDRKNINLDASYILVQGGLMEIGTEDEPFEQQVTITLHGDRRKSVELPFIGAKVLAVADRGGFTTHGMGRGVDVPLSQRGVLDIHGKTRLRTWTKVAMTAPKGTKRIVTSEPTDFAPGEKIVVTAPHQEVTVDQRIDNMTFTIVEPLEQTHVSEEWRTDGHEIDMRFEVALLSRNIIIQGAGGPRGDGTPTLEDDGEVASTSQLFGVHTGAFHGGHYRVENTELRHCGQSGVLGRYCMHLHVCGDNGPPNTYIKSNSIHHSFQRATTIHGTHHSLVQNNVAYHVMGHTYFVEDGDEMYNTFDSNIGIFTRPHHMMLKSDKEPATFWTAIPTNYWRNNIATDSSARGAWFELMDQGITLEFFNNTFHHNSGIGFRNYPNYSPPSPQYFLNNSYFRNGGNGLFLKKGGDIHHVHSKFAQNGVDIFWKKYSTHLTSRLIPNVKDCVFWGGRNAQAIFAPQHEYWYADGAKFINYGETTGAISACAGCCSPVTFRQGAYTTRFENLEWENSPKRTQWTCPYKQILLDLDGSLTGYKGGTALPSYKFNEWDGECWTEAEGENMYSGGRRGMICNDKVRVRRLQIKDNEPRELDDKRFSLKKSETVQGGIPGKLTDVFGNSDKFGAIDWDQYHKSGLLYEGTCDDPIKSNGETPLDFSGCDSMDGLDWINYRQSGINGGEYDGWAIPVATHHDYFADIDWHIDFQKLTMRWSETYYFEESYNLPLENEESAMLRFPYIDFRYKYRVKYEGDSAKQLRWYDQKPLVGTNTSKQLDRFDNFGEGLILRNDDSLKTTDCCGEWKVAMNPWSQLNTQVEQVQNVTQLYSSAFPITEEKGGNTLLFTTDALQCGPGMCTLPGGNGHGEFGEGKSSDAGSWSSSGGTAASESEHNIPPPAPPGSPPAPPTCNVGEVGCQPAPAPAPAPAGEEGAPQVGEVIPEKLKAGGSNGENCPDITIPRECYLAEACKYIDVIPDPNQRCKTIPDYKEGTDPSSWAMEGTWEWGNEVEADPDGGCLDSNDRWDEDLCPCMKWSNRSTWQEIVSRDIHTVDVEMTGEIPAEDDRVEIPRLVCVLYDYDSPALDKLVVAGRLKFDGENRRLDVDRFVIWGFLEVGTAAEPYPIDKTAEIVLHGVRTSSTTVLSDQHFLGNKNMIVFGDVQMHGGVSVGADGSTPCKDSWVELSATTPPNSNTLELARPACWKVGDHVMVTSTEYPDPIGFEDHKDGGYLENYNPHQTEEFVIASIAGTTVTVEGKIKYRHFAGEIDIGGGKTITLNAHVALLSRNVIVRGDTCDAPVDGKGPGRARRAVDVAQCNDDRIWHPGYGGHIVVGEVNYGSKEEMDALRRAGEVLGVTQKLGSLHASNVQFVEMGKLASEHAAITYRFFNDLKDHEIPLNRIEDCAFNKGWNYAVVTDKSFNVELLGNVVDRSFRTAIDIDKDSMGTTIKNNLITNVHRSPDDYNPSCLNDQSCWNNPFSGIMLWNKEFAELSGNVVAGSEDTGITIYPVDECNADKGELRVFDNIVYGAVVGMYILDNRGAGCVKVHGIKAWKNAHIGIVTVDQSSDLKLVEAIVSDNHEGISLNFVKAGWKNLAAVEDSVIVGSSPASDTQRCKASMECRAMKGGDTRGLKCNSVFGSDWRRVGIVMPQYTNLKKTCEGQGTGGTGCRPPNRVFRMCSLPWDFRFGNPDVQHAKFEITRTTFAYWKTNDCGKKSRAIALNPTQPDLAPETILSELTWDMSTIDKYARFQLGDATYQKEEAVACTTEMCDAVNFFKMKDTDGTTISDFWDDGSNVEGKAFTMLSSYNPALAAGDKCRSDPSTQSIVCQDYPLARLVLEADPPRFTARRVGPATCKKYSEQTLFDDMDLLKTLNMNVSAEVFSIDERTIFSVGPFPQGCSCQKHFAQFTFDVEPGLSYDIFTMGVLQDKNRLSYHSQDASECIVARIFMAKPQAVEIISVASGAVVAPVLNGVKPTVTDPEGTNMMHPQDRQVYVTLCGGGGSVFWVNYGSQVMVTAVLKMSVDEFFATEFSDTRTKGTDAFVMNIATLLQIDASQIKVTCVHHPGKPCIPLEAERRVRRATDGVNVTFPEDDDAEEYLVIEFEISAAEPEVMENAPVPDWCEADCTYTNIDGATKYLSMLVYHIMDDIDAGANGTLINSLIDAGYNTISIDVDYENLRLLNTTTTATTTFNISDVGSGSGSGSDFSANFSVFVDFDLDGDGFLSNQEVNARLLVGVVGGNTVDNQSKSTVQLYAGPAVMAELFPVTNDVGDGSNAVPVIVFDGMPLGEWYDFVAALPTGAKQVNPTDRPLFDAMVASAVWEMDNNADGLVSAEEFDAWYAIQFDAFLTSSAGTAESKSGVGNTIAIVLFLLVCCVMVAVMTYRMSSLSDPPTTAYASSDATQQNPGFELPQYETDAAGTQVVDSNPNWQRDSGSLKFVKGKAAVGGDDGESYFSRNGRATLVKDSLMIRRPDESSSDDVSASRQSSTAMPAFVEQSSKVTGGGELHGNRLATNAMYGGAAIDENPQYHELPQHETDAPSDFDGIGIN
jgi:hypothetical protein